MEFLSEKSIFGKSIFGKSRKRFFGKSMFIIHTNCNKPGINNYSKYQKNSDLISKIHLGKCNLEAAKSIFETTNDKATFKKINQILVDALNSESSIKGGNTTVYLHNNFALRILQENNLNKKDNEYNAGYIQTYLSEKCDMIPKIYAIGMYQENRPFQLMEHVGTELYTEVVKKKTNVNVNLFKRCADTVKCMHDNDIVHRDIKPENITIKDNEMFVIDFGHANHKSSISNEPCGTRNYIPHQLLYYFFVEKSPPKYTIDFLKKCDIYMLALTMLLLEQKENERWWNYMTSNKSYNTVLKWYRDKHRSKQNVDYTTELEPILNDALHKVLDENIEDEKKRDKYKKYINKLGDEHTIDNFIKDFFPSGTSQGGNSRTHKSKKTRNKKRRKTRNKKRNI